MGDAKAVKDLTTAELCNLIKCVNLEQTADIKLELKNNLDNITGKVIETDLKVKKLEEKVAVLERKSRKNNIVLFGLAVVDKTKLLEETLKKFTTLLGVTIEPSQINNIFLLNQQAEKSPAIIVEFVSFLQKSLIFKNVHKLKGTGISIAHDASYEDRQKQKTLVYHLKQAKDQNLDAKITKGSLKVGEVLYSVEQLKALELEIQSSSSEIETEEIEVAEEENQVTGNRKPPVKRKRNSINYSPKTRNARKERNK